ncbi:MAG: hypothetical protein NXY57DRAFT_533372 [Lentinula lateritia]|nr:MAG: hypothetical protein NXY57DRAFT_533372 [Lentinula lateritia]
MTPDFDDIPLPEGWVEEFHESGHPYYVDTLANPPRSIWIHPYEDEVYLRQHPEDQGKLQAWMAADSKSRSPSPLPDGRSPLYTEDVKVAPVLGDEGRSSREYYDSRGPGDAYAPGMSTGSHMGDRGLLGGGRGLGGLGGDGRGFEGGGRRGLIGGLLGALTERTEMAQESRGAYYEPRYGMGGGLGGPGMMMMGGRGFGMPMDRRTERFMRINSNAGCNVGKRNTKDVWIDVMVGAIPRLHMLDQSIILVSIRLGTMDNNSNTEEDNIMPHHRRLLHHMNRSTTEGKFYPSSEVWL